MWQPPFLPPETGDVLVREVEVVTMHQPLAPALESFIDAMPKVELHLHLEGSIRPGTLLRIAERNGVDLPARDERGVAQLFNYQSFHEFLTVFMILARSLMRGEDFELLAYELGHHLADQNVRYAEVMISVDVSMSRRTSAFSRMILAWYSTLAAVGTASTSCAR